MTLDVAVSALRAWRADPVRMVRDLFGVEPDVWQIDALRAWAENGSQRLRLALQACAGPGKSAVLAWLGWNGLLCYSDGMHHPCGAAVSITAENLKNNLWKELAFWRDQSPLLQAAFDMTAERIFSREFPATWYLSARSFAKSANPEAQGRTLSGLHGKFIFYLIDESGDMPPAVLRTAEQGLGNCEWGRIAQAGNPTSQDGALYQTVTQQAHLWRVIRITGDPDDPARSARIDLAWAREQILIYGRENPWVMAYILGEFPPNALNTLLGPDDVAAAQHRYGALETHAYGWAQKRIGVDVARFGDDRTVIFPRQGIAAFLPEQLRQRDTVQVAGRVAWWINEWAKEDRNTDVQTFVDDSGHWGHGVIDNLRAGGYPAKPVLFEDRNTADPRHFNRRAEMWISMAEWIKTIGALPPDLPGEIVAELTTPQYVFREGKFLIEPKDTVKKRLGRSPDLADALALTFAVPDMPAQIGQRRSGRGSQASQHDWNPLDTVAA